MTYEPFDDEPLTDETPDDKELTDLIDLWLSDDRPERYDATDKDWMDDAVEKATEQLKRRPNADEVIHDAARRRVYQREGQATKTANRNLRNIAKTGALPLGWGEGDDWKSFLADVLNRPLSIAHMRVRFGAASATDLEQWELENAREEDKRRLAQIETREGARLLADWLRKQGAQRVEDVRTVGGGAAPGE